jgi:hypothetical protein
MSREQSASIWRHRNSVPLVRYNEPVRIVAVGLGTLLLIVGIVQSVPAIPDLDFVQYYAAVQSHEQGGSLYDRLPRARKQTWAPAHGNTGRAINWHPPIFHVLVWPFTRLPLVPAHLLWVTLSLLGTAAMAYAMRPASVRSRGSSGLLPCCY